MTARESIEIITARVCDQIYRAGRPVDMNVVFMEMIRALADKIDAIETQTHNKEK